MAVSEERVKEVVEYALLNGSDKAMEAFTIPSDTLNRYQRKYKQKYGAESTLMGRVREKFTDADLSALLSMDVQKRPRDKGTVVFDGEDFCFLAMSDTHVGSIFFEEAHLLAAFEEGHKQGATHLLHGGDIMEGMSGRPGHIYELDRVGYSAQLGYAVELFKQWDKPMLFCLGNHDCHTPDTECLTKEGWKHYSQLTTNDLVFSYDTETSKGRWMPITEVIVRPHSGDIYNFNQTSFKHSVTPNHRMMCAEYTKDHSSPAQGYKYTSAQDIAEKGKHYKAYFKVAAKMDETDYAISDDMLRVVVWLLTDGGISRNKPEHAGNYIIYQSKDPSSIIHALEGAGLPYTHHIRTRDITEICGKKLKAPPLPEQNFRLTKDGVNMIRGYLPTKDIPDWMYQISDRQFDIVSSVLLQANGSAKTGCSKSNTNVFALHGTRDSLSKWQIVFATHGYSAGLRYDTRGASVLDVCRREDTVLNVHSALSISEYTGEVWCITTPLTNFMVRKGGRPSFTGNCWVNTKAGSGVDVGADFAGRVPGAMYLGIHEGVFTVNGVDFMLWHGEDGSSYATSYRIQKIIEAFSGGEKPQVLLTAHTHKMAYIFDRNVHAVSTGSIQKQSGFMRYKRLPAHVGFWILRGTIRKGEVTRFSPTWYPFYK